MIRCNACQGRKTIMGLGTLERDCTECNGTGWIENEVQFDSDDEIDKTKQKTVIIHKKVRRKRIQNEN